MLRIVAGRIVAASRKAIQPRVMTVRSSSHGKEQTDEEVDAEFIQYFDRKDIDHWELRSAMNRLAGKKKTFFFPFTIPYFVSINFSPLSCAKIYIPPTPT